jgi:hypothetical protein
LLSGQAEGDPAQSNSSGVGAAKAIIIMKKVYINSDLADADIAADVEAMIEFKACLRAALHASLAEDGS